MRSVLRWVSVVAIGLAALACVGSAPPAVAGPFAANDPRIVERALLVAAQRGYRPEAIDRSLGTFYVHARSDPRTPVSFEVRCTRDGWVLVVPRGDRVQVTDGVYRMPSRIRDEYLGFAAALNVGIDLPVAGGESSE